MGGPDKVGGLPSAAHLSEVDLPLSAPVGARGCCAGAVLMVSRSKATVWCRQGPAILSWCMAPTGVGAFDPGTKDSEPRNFHMLTSHLDGLCPPLKRKDHYDCQAVGQK